MAQQQFTSTSGTHLDVRNTINSNAVDAENRITSLETGGVSGDSAYEVAVSEGFVGDETAWLASLVGADGAAGLDGKTVLNGTVVPTTEGVDGDFYIKTDTSDIYGPKTGGAWGAATSLIGADGADGADGATGAAGAVGTNGLDGKTVLNGTAVPTTEGVDGDFYIKTDTSDLYGPKTGGAWGAATSLIGADGADGADGAAGSDGAAGTNGLDGKTVLNGTAVPTTEGVDGDFYIKTDTSDLYGPKTGGAWGPATSLIGADGADGADGAAGSDGAAGTNGLDGKTVLNGTAVPTTEGVDGDFYIKTDTSDLYGPKTGGAWGAATSLIGADGADGAAGAAGSDGAAGTNGLDGKTVLNGTAVPTTEGVDGDFYIKTDTSDLYGPKTGGAWGAATSLIGADGADGVAGTDGAAGAAGLDGKTVLNGTVVPTTEGVDGDFYIKTDTSDLYGPKTGGAWGPATSLIGADGADGATGAAGADGTSVVLKGSVADFASLPAGASAGDLYITLDTGDGWVSDGAEGWSNVGAIQGPAGADGAAGLDGKTVLNGTAVPTTEGVDGDFYIKTDTSDLYGPKTGGAWGAATSLIGADGADGVAGTDGAAGTNGLDGKTVLNGTVVPTTEGVDGDFYIKTDTSDLYGPKTGGAWGPATSLIGADGADGVAGTDGAAGTNGLDGKTVLNGTAVPTTEGVDGDFYIKTDTSDLYGPKTGGAWGAATSLIGADGADGVAGTDGAAGTNGLDGKTVLNGTAVPTTEGVDGDFYIKTDTSDLYGPKTGGAWGPATSLIGADGADGVAGTDGAAGTNGLDGKTVLNGTAVPTTEGVDGDFYIKTDTSDLYGPKTGGAWGAATSLIGADGADGVAGTDGAAGTNGLDGKTVLNGTAVPTTEGVDGDFYIKTDTSDLYGPKTGGAWGAATSLIGADGADGVAGTDGAAGTNGLDGKTVLNGTAVPTTEGVDGDFYIKTDTSDLYGPKTGGAWGAATSLIGADGAAGADAVTDDTAYGISWDGNLDAATKNAIYDKIETLDGGGGTEIVESAIATNAALIAREDTPYTDSVAGLSRGSKAVDLQLFRSLNSQIAGGNNSVIIGGSQNKISDLGFGVDADYGSILGGLANDIQQGSNSTILGGSSNQIGITFGNTSDDSIVCGRYARALHNGTFVFNSNTANTHFDTLLQETFNIQAANGLRLITDGTQTAGQVLTCDANGHGTWQTAAAAAADVSYDNTASGFTATNVQAAIDEVEANSAVIYQPAGQSSSYASTVTKFPTGFVGSDGVSVAGLSRGNDAVDLQTRRSVSDQIAAAPSSIISGGALNKISYSEFNTNSNTTICGGTNNLIDSGASSIILGGTGNKIGDYPSFFGADSVVCGRYAHAKHPRTFVFSGDAAGSNVNLFETLQAETFNIKAANGLRLVTDGTQTAGQVLTCDADGHGTWQTAAAATDATSGIVELATQAEADAGTDTTRVITPATLSSAAFPSATVISADSLVIRDLSDNKLKLAAASALVFTSDIGTTVQEPIDGLSLTDVGVPLSNDTILIQDAGDNNLKGTAVSNFMLAGSVTKTHKVTTTNYTAGTSNEVIILADTSAATGANGAITITLPSAASSTDVNFYVKKIDADANNVTIDGNSTETIDGAETKVISTQWDTLQIVSDGTEWFIISN